MNENKKDKNETVISDSILEYVKTNGHKPFMITEVAEQVGTTFDTAKDHLLQLAATGVLEIKKVNRHWIFWKKNEITNK